MSYEIAVDRLSARMVTRDGGDRQATFYLHQASPHAPRHESVGDRLNDLAIEFLPCEVDGAPRLIPVDWIVYVELPEPPPELSALEEVGAECVRVSLDLVTGAQLQGELVFEGRVPRTRVSDFLNTTAERFLLLRSSPATLYVNRRAVTRVSF